MEETLTPGPNFNRPVKDLMYKDLLTSTFTQASHDRGIRTWCTSVSYPQCIFSGNKFRYETFICTVGVCRHNLPIDHYFDDFMLVCLKDSILRDHTGKTWKSSGQCAFSNLCTILWWSVETKKRKDTDSENELLGIHTSLARFKHEAKIVFNPTEKRGEGGSNRPTWIQISRLPGPVRSGFTTRTTIFHSQYSLCQRGSCSNSTSDR
jgi:hypothetical protein